MNVLHVHSGNLYGGVETLLTTLATQRKLCPAMKPQFALCFQGRLEKELRNAGVAVYMLGSTRIRRPASVLRARRVVTDLVRQGSFDIVVCHSSWSQAIFGPVIRDTGLPIAFWMHGPVAGRHWIERWARRVKPDLVICNSRFTSESASNLYSDIQVEVIYCPLTDSAVRLSPMERSALRLGLQTNESDVVIIQVGRMEEWKGHLLHLEALSILRDVPGWTCWIIGGAQRPAEIAYLKRVKRQAERLRIADRVRFAGSRDDVPRLLSAADIFCQPNTGPEPFGMVFVEALFSRLPIVTTNIGGAREIIDETCGALVPSSDSHALAHALRQLLQTPERRTELGAGSPERARRLCDPHAQLVRLHTLFDTCVRRNDSRAATPQDEYSVSDSTRERASVA
jgi:glycosyltransferase involved in cell wall biosynthesis